jgi:hypothetical protein
MSDRDRLERLIGIAGMLSRRRVSGLPPARTALGASYGVVRGATDRIPQHVQAQRKRPRRDYDSTAAYFLHKSAMFVCDRNGGDHSCVGCDVVRTGRLRRFEQSKR